ncbi:MAG TPA: hypothetical protein VFC51_04875 [Chloroflexota bacterium]|nr:hypothetical protein [Chloroflexota bacterium]
MERDSAPGGELRRRILELEQQIDEVERIVESWPRADEPAFVQALRARARRFRRELAEAIEQVDDAAGPPPEPPDPPAPQERAVEPGRMVFRIPGWPDVDVTREEWDAIQEILRTRRSGAQPEA